MITSLAPIIALLVALQNSPDDAAKKSAEELARQYAQATVKSDFAKVIDLTYPLAVDAVGGREKAIQRAQDELKRAQRGGVRVLSLEKVVSPGKVFATKRAHYCVVPISFHLKVEDSNYLLRSALIGISIDFGKTWKFVDISMGEKIIRRYIPDVPGELEFPPKAEMIREDEAAK
jgi:hypothetical protein